MWRKIFSILTTAIVLQHIPNVVLSLQLEAFTGFTQALGSLIKSAAKASDALSTASGAPSNSFGISTGSAGGVTDGANNPIGQLANAGGNGAIPIQITGIMTTMTGEPLGVVSGSITGLNKETEKVESTVVESSDALTKVKELLTTSNVATGATTGASDSSTVGASDALKNTGETATNSDDAIKSLIERIKALSSDASEPSSKPNEGVSELTEGSESSLSKTSDTSDALRSLTEALRILSGDAGSSSNSASGVSIGTADTLGSTSGASDSASTASGSASVLTSGATDPIIGIVGITGGPTGSSFRTIPLGSLTGNLGSLTSPFSVSNGFILG